VVGIAGAVAVGGLGETIEAVVEVVLGGVAVEVLVGLGEDVGGFVEVVAEVRQGASAGAGPGQTGHTADAVVGRRSGQIVGVHFVGQQLHPASDIVVVIQRRGAARDLVQTAQAIARIVDYGRAVGAGQAGNLDIFIIDVVHVLGCQGHNRRALAGEAVLRFSHRFTA